METTAPSATSSPLPATATLCPKAIGTWSGGRFMRFGRSLGDEGLIDLLMKAPEHDVRTFITSDVYAKGGADKLMGKAISAMPGEEIQTVSMIGHDFYNGGRKGAGGYDRFTNPDLREEEDYARYLTVAAERSLERCGLESFDAILLHNPDRIGYSSPVVWEAMASLRERGLTNMLGVAPGPANGFVLDLIGCFEKFGGDIDWAMIILNPLEPWPGRLVLPAAEKFGVEVMTRVVDHSGLFHGDVRQGHHFLEGDHRNFRPEGWVEEGLAKIDKMRPIAERHGLTLLQLASYWNLAHTPVHSVVPTFIEEDGANTGARTASEKLAEMAAIDPAANPLTPEEVEEIARAGDNTGCMALKGGSYQHEGEAVADAWPLDGDLPEIAERWGIDCAW